MGYDLSARHDIEYFHLGAFSWPILLEAFGYLFPEIHKDGKFLFLTGADERYDSGTLGSNDSFRVTANEARIMARMARNYVAIQRALEPQESVDIFQPCYMQPWPKKICEDFVDKFEKFAEWAERSGGFTIG